MNSHINSFTCTESLGNRGQVTLFYATIASNYNILRRILIHCYILIIPLHDSFFLIRVRKKKL